MRHLMIFVFWTAGEVMMLVGLTRVLGISDGFLVWFGSSLMLACLSLDRDLITTEVTMKVTKAMENHKGLTKTQITGGQW